MGDDSGYAHHDDCLGGNSVSLRYRTGKGFAVTLVFGLLANLFTAVFVSRVIFDALLERKGRAAVLSI